MEDARGDAYVANHGGSKFDKAPSLAVGRKKNMAVLQRVTVTGGQGLLG